MNIPASRMPTDYDKIAVGLAMEMDMVCYNRGMQEGTAYYRFTLNKGDHRHRGILEIPGGWTTRNPCREIPLEFELHVKICGNIITIHDDPFIFDLNEPDSITKILDLLSDLDRFSTKAKDAYHNRMKKEFHGIS